METSSTSGTDAAGPVQEELIPRAEVPAPRHVPRPVARRRPDRTTTVQPILDWEHP